MISIRRVHLIYSNEKVHALRNVNLEFTKGEMCFIVGQTGCGKSSLLKLIYVDELPSRGQVIVLGKDTFDVSEREMPYLRRKIGVVFQDFKLLAAKTVYENVAYPLEVTGASRYEISRRVPQVLELVGLSDKRDMFPHSLARGQEQRVAIARAIVNNPMILIADEPTGNLDPDTSMDIINLLLRIQMRGTSVIIASHDIPSVERANKRIIRIVNGEVESDEQPSQPGMQSSAPTITRPPSPPVQRPAIQPHPAPPAQPVQRELPQDEHTVNPFSPPGGGETP